jgi:LPXTG-motif cell wall-anchored protein
MNVREASPQNPTEINNMKSLRTKLAAVVIAVAAIVAAPAAANASTPNYPPAAPDLVVSGSIVAGGTITLGALNFDFNTTITFTLTGENAASVTQAAVKTVRNTSPAFTSTTDGTGAASVAVKLPANASGTYEIAVTGLRGGQLVTETSSLVVSTGGATGGLPATGVDSASLMGVWIGGGVLLLGGLAVTVFAVRRQRETV